LPQQAVMAASPARLVGDSLTPTEDMVMRSFKQGSRVRFGIPTQRRIVGAWLLLIMCLVLTIWAWRVAKSDAETDARERFDFQKTEIISAIHARMAAYEQVLRGVLGLLSVSGEVTRAQWRAYVQTLSIQGNYPGIQGIGYIKWISPADKAAYIAQMRAEGFSGFSVRPDGQRDAYAPITYLEPFDRRNRQAIGYDMWSEAIRRAAMQEARDIATTSISGKVTLVQEIDADIQAGFLMFLPYYGRGNVPATAEERRTALVGFVYSPFRLRDLMEGILGRALPDVRLEIFDGVEMSATTAMYDSQSAASAEAKEASPALSDTAHLEIYGHTWTARLTALSAFGSSVGEDRPLIILISGSLIGLLFFGILWSFASTQARAEAIARDMTKTLDHHVEELARSNAELEQFAYVASHDLQEPLRAVAGCVQLFQQRYQGQLDGRADVLIAHIVDGAVRMQALIHDLLAYSRIDSRSLRFELVDCSAVLRSVLANLEVAVKESGAVVTQGALPGVMANRLQLAQLFQNLLSNAVKFRGEQPPDIHVGAEYQAGEWRFAVRDNGIGIAPPYHERIFAVFQRLHTRREYAGTGIGLAICKKIVEHHGGRIWVESEPAKGASFFFTLPDRR
jgi:signal transduction histidine kinase